jgi:hypothetical protein
LIFFIIKFLPFSSDYLAIKFGAYLDNERTGFRITGLLSIIGYPLMIYKLEKYYNTSKLETLFFNNKKSDMLFMYMLYAIILYGAAINLGYFNNPHMAGRLSRMSDYAGMGLVLPSYLAHYYKKESVNIVFFILVLLAPILYASVYMNVNWGFV